MKGKGYPIIAKSLMLIFSFYFAIEVQAQESGYSNEGSLQCVGCHDKMLHSIAHLSSSDTEGINRNCESCHGPSESHAKRPKKFSPAIGFGPTFKSPVTVQNTTCLGCHQNTQADWQVSAHETQELSCVNCHNSHSVTDPVLSARFQVETCSNCHGRTRNEFNLPSHHPVKEEKMVCSDCHDPHGSMNEFQLTSPTAIETCFGCHAEKRGPFLFEHSPASEDCALCHNPHGSINANLLNTRTPFLCQQCHSAAFHPSVALSGVDLPGQRPNALLLGKNCMNCHNQVHGSNHPSGPALTR